jgi:hypothetical protein
MKRPGLREVTKEQRFWPLLSVLLGALVVVLIVVNSTSRGKLLAYRMREESLNAKMEDLRTSVRNCLKELEAAPRLSVAGVNRLREKGLGDPVSDLKLDLMEHPKLIPYRGSMGGTMGFYSEERIWVLNDRWVLAAFEDGHRAGSMVLSYTVQDGRIDWTVEGHSLD